MDNSRATQWGCCSSTNNENWRSMDNSRATQWGCCYPILLTGLLASGFWHQASGSLPLTRLLLHKGFHHRCHLLTEATAIEDAVVPHPCHFQVLFADRRDIAAQIQRARGLASAGNIIQLTFHGQQRSEEHTSELQSRENLVCRLLLEK